jgi:hypothetical protein
MLTGLTVCAALADDAGKVQETAISTPQQVTIKVRMQGPYDMQTPLQVVCFFKHKASGDHALGAAVELDERLGGLITRLRSGGDFEGEALETLLLTPPANTIPAQKLLLIGLGDESTLSLDGLEAIGKTALREAARLGIDHVAFAPLIRDQGNSALDAGESARAVLRGVLIANDTQSRLHTKGYASEYRLVEWVELAGPKYFDGTVTGANSAVEDANAVIAKAAEL